ncbi:hypothetical protein [Pseudomonas sp. S1_E04]
MRSLPSVSPPAQTVTQSLLTQLSVGPAFREVAGVLLRDALQTLYPHLNIDPTVAQVGAPDWTIVGDQVIALAPRYQSLTGVLVRQAIMGTPTLYLEGNHFLIQDQTPGLPKHLPVRIEQIGNQINLLAPAMLKAYQEQQVEFWNDTNGRSGPRWRELSNTLRKVWNVHQLEGWDATDCSLARQLFAAPDVADRPDNVDGNEKPRAYLIDVDEIDGTAVKHLFLLPIAVLIGRRQGREIILSHSLLHGYEKFDSLEAIGRSLEALLQKLGGSHELQWRLVEPAGDFFDHQACAWIALQVAMVDKLDAQDLQVVDPMDSALHTPPGAMARPAEPIPGPAWFDSTLPDWLRKASSNDQVVYARHLKDLAALHSLHGGQSFQDGIAPIAQYTLDALRSQLLKDHADAGRLNLDAIRFQIQSPVVLGSFTMPGQVDTHTYSLVELALQNLAGLPLGNKSIRQENGGTPPAWLTVDYVENLVKQVDIGKHYPALVQRTLLDDAHESERRQGLFTSHLRIQLPLLALQYKIRQQAGVDELGYRYVVAVLASEPTQRQVQGQVIVLRPLAFIPENRPGSAADSVANMFVIGPQDPAAGPCLLYRPMLEPPLSQYPSPANLLYDIQQSPALRRSVLAWLADDVREDYLHYVFPGEHLSPWTVVDFLADPFKLWSMGGTLSLGQQTLEGDLFEQLFKANANALVKQADQQSVSNAESRWATLKQAGWLAFSAVLPFLGRTVNSAAWIWQIIDQWQAVVDAEEQQDKPAEWAALTAVLLNLGMALVLHAARRDQPPPSKQGKVIQTQPPELPAPPKVSRQLPTLPAHELPAGHRQGLHSFGAVTRDARQLAQALDSFKVDKPVDLGAQAEAGLHRHLYPHAGKWYAPVGTRWFEVIVDDNDNVRVQAPEQPTRLGPLLIANRRGEWFIDTRLRLLGGGPKKLIAKAKTQAETQAQVLRTRLSAFESQKQSAQEQLQLAQQAMQDAPSTSQEAQRQHYLQTLETQRNDYETALQNFKALNVFTPTSNFLQGSLGYLKAQLSLSQAGIQESLKRFTPKIETVLEQIERQAEVPTERHIGDAREMSELSQDMINRLEYVQTRFTELKQLSREGLELMVSASRQLPSYTVDDLKALRVTLSRNLCLQEHSTQTVHSAWSALDQIVDVADIAIQSLRDTLQERSETRLDERIDTLGSLLEQFSVLDERLQDFPDEFGEPVQQSPLNQLREQLREFRQRAASHLATLAAERSHVRTRPTPPPTPPRPRKRFIRTRFNGMLIGEPRLSEVGLDTGLVDVHSPLTHKVVATFHEKQPGVWVQRVSDHRTPPPTVDLSVSLNEGQQLLNGLVAFKARATALAGQPKRTAIGIEHLYHQHAQHLEQASGAIEEALTRSNDTGSSQPLAASLSRQLSEAAQTLYQQANLHVIRMLKEQPPTPSSVEWLKARNEITIKRSIKRRRIKSPKPDYLDEYTLTDNTTRQPLWYAHFHYSSTWANARSFLSARLKTPQEHGLGAAADLSAKLTPEQQIDFLRSEISQQQALALFFKPASGT